MKAKRIMYRAFAILLIILCFDIVSLLTILPSIDDFLGGYLTLSVLRSMAIIIVLGILVYEVSKES